MHEHLPAADADRRSALEAAVRVRMPVVNGPHVWIGTLASYEAATPRGGWVTANQPLGELDEAVQRIVRGARLAGAPGESDDRWGVFAEIGFGRYPPPLITTAAGIARHARCARDETRAFHAWAAMGNGDRPQLERFYDFYLGRYDRFDDWLNFEIERAGWDSLIDRVLPAELRAHVDINLESFGHELLASGVVRLVPDDLREGVFVFRGP